MFEWFIIDKKTRRGAHPTWRGVAGVVEIRMIQPFGIVNHNLTFKPGFYRVYQNVAPPTIGSLGRRPRKGAFLFGERITVLVTSYHTVLTDPVTLNANFLNLYFWRMNLPAASRGKLSPIDFTSLNS
jgi:hypothetical protein